MRSGVATGPVTRLGRRVRAAVFLRSLAIQGSWNYRTLLGTGFAFALLPALRALYRDEPERLREAVERHSRIFNSHPYLAPMALGAVTRLEAEGEDAAVVERFKAALRGSLGTLGDRLVWAGWRPVCLLLALALVLAGAAWWVGVAVFVVIYNAGHLALRVWSYRLGLREGKCVGECLRRYPIGAVQRLLAGAGAFLVGLVLPLAATGGLVGNEVAPPWVAVAAGAAVAGAWLGSSVRTPIIVSLAVFALLGFALRMTQ